LLSMEDDNDHAGRVLERNPSDYETHWRDTWAEFNRSLRSTADFNAFHWVYRLFSAGLRLIYYRCGLSRLQLHTVWRSSIPCFAILLVLLVELSYFGRLRVLLSTRWCMEQDSLCRSSFILNDIFVAYLGLMILFNYVSACFRSPGVALSSQYSGLDESSKVPYHLTWKASHGQGGMCGINASLRLADEQRRIQLCEELFSSNDWTFCNKCNIQRPPRTHHCGVSDRCVIRYDHHCAWLNNTIGYNNYRQFLLILFYLTVGCWYGIAVLSFPFYEILKENIAKDGWRFLYGNGTGFLDLPLPIVLLTQLFSNTADDKVLVKLVFPFLLSVGTMIGIFFSQHLKYTLTARTTLEHKIFIMQRFRSTMERHDYASVENPYDLGWYLNLKLVLGPNLFFIFLPISVDGRLHISEDAYKTD